ncbi:MAG: phosphoenolpyruvate synthase [Bacteriovoracia bacterium]
MKYEFIKSFDEISMLDLPLVGGKNASLGEMYRVLRKEDINIPDGFAVITDAFTKLLEEKNISEFIFNSLDSLDVRDVGKLKETGKKIREAMQSSGLPEEVAAEVRKAYRELCKRTGIDNLDVAVRSSATAEDLPEASFAGQQETFLNVRGEEELLKATLNCFASLYTDRAISYRHNNKIEHRKVKLSVGIQQMIRSDLASSGVIFTLDTESGSRNVILITASWGLGENIVGGKVDPDEYLVLKPLLSKSKDPVIRKKIGKKHIKMVYSEENGKSTKDIGVPPEEQNSFCLSLEEMKTLAKWSYSIEKYYSKLNHRDMPMDIEWAKDGKTGELFILQARPETVHANFGLKEVEIMSLDESSKILLKGKAVGSKIGSGPVKIVRSSSELSEFKEGEVLVTEMTDPDWEPVMKKAAAIITDRGGRTCHAAIVSREHGVPCIVGTGKATTTLQDGQEVTVSCAEGEEGLIMEGKLPYSIKKIDWSSAKKTRTKVMVNLGNPDIAFKTALMPVDGVGLARLEFIIAEHVKVHPMALVNFSKTSEKTRNEVSRVIKGYEEMPVQYFIDRLAEGIATLSGAFYPRPVIVRLSDFKTNEYAHLLGGEEFEPKEENPMIGFRGASRYYHEKYREGFALECKAIKYVRDEMGLSNVKIMIPFCRTANEGKRVIEEMKKNGLVQGENGLQVYVMCEIPSNVLEAEAFGEVFDGFSIGSNDLTQMTLGVDRDSELVSHLFDERDPASLKMLDLAIQGAKKAQRPIGICGQAPSDYPEVTEFLVDRGIDSISLSPDSVQKAFEIISKAESKKLYTRETGHDENYSI